MSTRIRRRPVSRLTTIFITVAIIGTLATLIGLTVYARAHAATVPTRPALPYWERTPCRQEGSVNCYWNAAQQGNGHGWSYFVRQVPGSRRMVCVFYSRHPSYDYCEATR